MADTFRSGGFPRAAVPDSETGLLREELAGMARRVGEPEQKAALRREYAALRRRIGRLEARAKDAAGRQA